MPTEAQISVFVHWESQLKDMSMVDCLECPFLRLCKEKTDLCALLKQYITTIKKEWGL